MEKNVAEMLREHIKDVLDPALKTLAEKIERQEKVIAELEERMKNVKPERKGVFVDDSDVKEFRKLDELLVYPAKEGSLVEEFQKANDDVLLVAQLLNKDPRSLKSYQRLQEIVKALDTSTAGSGAEFIPTGYSAKLYEEIKLQLKVANLFKWVQMSSDPWVIPVKTGDVTAYKAGENTDLSELASTPSTGNRTLQTSKLAAYVEFSSEFEEDSIIPAVDFIKSSITRAIAEGIENAIINGDTDGSLDSDNTSTSDQRRIFDGLRELCGDSEKVDVGGSVPTVEDFITILSKMDEYGLERGNLVWVISVSLYYKLVNLKDSAGNRVFQFLGNADPIVKGEVGRILGIPVVVSPKVRSDLNASGAYDGTTTDKTVILLVYPRGFLGGERRALKVVAEDEPKKDSRYIVATQRIGFLKLLTNEPVVALGYNVAY